MAKKEKIALLRGDEFDSIEEELSAAMNSLDETNTRILQLLESEHARVPQTTATLLGEEPPPEESAEPARDEA